MMKKYRHELIILGIIVVLSVVIGSINHAFFSITNLFNLLKSSIVMGMFSLGVLLVLISGDIDISFTAIAAFSMYVTSKIVLIVFPGSSIFVILFLSGVIGVILGTVNAVFISLFKLPGLIVTLGTGSAFRGIMLTFIGVKILNKLPASMVALSKSTILKHTLLDGRITGLSSGIIILAVFSILIALLLKFTVLGRAIYALGGDRVATSRAGFNIKGVQFFIYGTVGFLSGIAGVIHSSFMRNCNPFDLVGTELMVLAAVVLGGTSITGGKGSVAGALLGVFLLVLINNSLILVGVPPYWQKAVIGAIILLSTGFAAIENKRK